MRLHSELLLVFVVYWDQDSDCRTKANKSMVQSLPSCWTIKCEKWMLLPGSWVKVRVGRFCISSQVSMKTVFHMKVENLINWSIKEIMMTLFSCPCHCSNHSQDGHLNWITTRKIRSLPTDAKRLFIRDSCCLMRLIPIVRKNLADWSLRNQSYSP